MSQSINKHMIIGNIGDSLRAADLPSGSKVLNFSVATNRSWKDKDTSEVTQQTDWHNVSIFGKSAENAEKILKPGSYVYIEGESVSSTWEKDGQKHYSQNINCQEWKALSPRPKEDGNS